MVLDRRTFLASLPVAAGAFALAGCTGGDSAPAGSGPVEGDTQNLNVCVASFGNNYDVQDMGWRWMMAACYAGIYRDVADEENGEQFILDGAERIDISDDQTVYTFHLRQDAKWSDGEPVTAHDYVYGWKRLVNPEYGYSYSWYIDNVVGVTEYKAGTGSADDIALVALDDYTFQVTLTEPDATFEAKLVATPLYPTRQDIAEAAGDQWGKDWSLCVYNGPFCMSELVEDNRMVWTKNPEYWDADNVKLESVTWNLIDEDSTAAGMFDNGELDVLQTSGDYSVQYAEKAEAGEIQRLVTDYPGTQWLVFDNKNGLLHSGASGNIIIPETIEQCVVIPQAATFEVQEKIFAYKVTDGIANPVEVTVTKVNGGKDYIVTSGLAFGDTIVAEGAGLLRAGTRVQAEQPTAAPQAAPEAEATATEAE